MITSATNVKNIPTREFLASSVISWEAFIRVKCASINLFLEAFELFICCFSSEKMGSPMSIPLWLALGDAVILGKLVDMFLDVDMKDEECGDVEMTEEMSEEDPTD
jgi:hypothetical protein